MQDNTSEKLQPDQIADIYNKMNRQIPIAIMSMVGWQMLLQTSRMVNGKPWVVEVRDFPGTTCQCSGENADNGRMVKKLRKIQIYSQGNLFF